jgi:histidinol-phosphate aminotransferase
MTYERWNAAGAPLAIMTNPHAPSGALASAAELHKLALTFRGVLLVDEAYVDFVDPEIGHETSTMVAAYPNVLLLRTLSKGYSLAGLRLAYGLGAAELVAPMLSKTKDSYNVDAIAQAVGTAALEDVRSAARSWEAVRHERRALDLALTAIGFLCSPSQANFLLATVPAVGQWHSAEKVYRFLMARRIFVRWFNEGGLRDKLRISIGTPEENQHLWKLSGCLADRSRFAIESGVTDLSDLMLKDRIAELKTIRDQAHADAARAVGPIERQGRPFDQSVCQSGP